MKQNISENKMQGILVGCDKNQEWLLAWWWDHFSRTNSHYPVAFADFGMSPEGRAFCEARGMLFTIPQAAIAQAGALDPKTREAWEKRWAERGEKGNFWQLRQVWYNKVVALAHSPFHRTLWLDLDCEVRADLAPLFALPLAPAKLAVASYGTLILATKEGAVEITQYNSAVVLFERDSSLLHAWHKGIKEGSALSRSEEELLSLIAHHFQIKGIELPLIYNWEAMQFGPNPKALIYHWIGDKGKEIIRKSPFFFRSNNTTVFSPPLI